MLSLLFMFIFWCLGFEDTSYESTPDVPSVDPPVDPSVPIDVFTFIRSYVSDLVDSVLGFVNGVAQIFVDAFNVLVFDENGHISAFFQYCIILLGIAIVALIVKKLVKRKL